jgi:hypothetical protein
MQDFGQPAEGQGPPPPPGYGGYQQPPPPPPPGAPTAGYGAPPEKKSKLPLVAGIMFILALVFLFVSLGLSASALGAVESSGIRGVSADDASDALNAMWVQCVVMPLIGAIFLLLGAVFCFKAKNFKMAMIGGIIGLILSLLASIVFVAGIVVPNPIAILGFIFALLGVILAFAGKKSFS